MRRSQMRPRNTRSFIAPFEVPTTLTNTEYAVVNVLDKPEFNLSYTSIGRWNSIFSFLDSHFVGFYVCIFWCRVQPVLSTKLLFAQTTMSIILYHQGYNSLAAGAPVYTYINRRTTFMLLCAPVFPFFATNKSAYRRNSDSRLRV